MRHLSVLGSFALALCLLPSSVSAQFAQGEIVVPTFNVFSVGTTVSVPDRGNMVIGGSRNGSLTRNEFGPGFGRGLSSRYGAADAGVRVWIHDFQEREAALGKRQDRDSPTAAGFAGALEQYASTRTDVSGRQPNPSREHTASVTGSDRVELAASRAGQAADLLKRAMDAEARGKPKIALLYYRSALACGATPSAREARDRLSVLETRIIVR